MACPLPIATLGAGSNSGRDCPLVHRTRHYIPPLETPRRGRHRLLCREWVEGPQARCRGQMSGCDVCQVPTKGHTAGFTPPSRCRGQSVRKEESHPRCRVCFVLGSFPFSGCLLAVRLHTAYPVYSALRLFCAGAEVEKREVYVGHRQVCRKTKTPLDPSKPADPCIPSTSPDV